VTLSRDAIIIISVVVVNLTLGRRIFYPSMLGKLSTLTQLVSVGLVLLLNALDVTFRPAMYLFQLTLALTVASAVHYAYLGTVKRGEAPPA
jgi:cardiolipin synthase